MTFFFSYISCEKDYIISYRSPIISYSIPSQSKKKKKQPIFATSQPTSYNFILKEVTPLFLQSNFFSSSCGPYHGLIEKLRKIQALELSEGKVEKGKVRKTLSLGLKKFFL